MINSKNKTIVINGESWCHNLTGIERLAIEVTEALDTMVQPGEIELIVPSNAKNVPVLKNIKVVRIDYEAKSFPRWTQFVVQKYILKHHAVSLDYSNTCPIFAPGIEFLHDIYCKLYPQDFTSGRDKLVRLYSDFMYRIIAKHAKKIITVSEFTKKTIVDTYHINPDRVAVVYSGVGQYRNIPADDSVFNRLPQLRERSFYFTLGSLSTRKNLKWIADHAELYPDELFAVSGKALENVVPPELEKLKHLHNVVMTGYLSDEQVKALLKKCKAFVFPSYFEGFGLPPLEALSCGTPVIISNRTSLPEIYGGCAHYIDPDKPNVNLDNLLEEPVESTEKLLEKYTLKKTAERLYNVILKIKN
ncbi:MAG: glycosyltransferase family 1 protein [Treponema sp.]